MKPEKKTDDWESKYLDGVKTLEGEQQRFRSMEAILKRLTGRLCIASLGLSPQLDEEIKKLQAVLRRETSGDELEPLLAPLTSAIHALDEKAPLQPASTVPVNTSEATLDDHGIRATLALLLEELKRDVSLTTPVAALDARLLEPITVAALPGVLSTVIELVGQRIARIERAKQEAEELLSHMAGRLDEISEFVADQNQNQTQALASSESLNAQLTGEMQAMGDSVEAASDLAQIRTQVRSRLDVIGNHLQAFRSREQERASSMQTRAEKMQARMVELEIQTKKLQSQLKMEQQLAMVDALTKVPNRMAYDKRIEEEMKRWQRFNVATCLVVWDIDHFKRINDTYGHRAGDRVLQTLAECLHKRKRSTDFLARYGGEEFVMLLSGANANQTMAMMEELRIAVGKLALHFKGTPVDLTASCGVTELTTGDTAASAFERADKALYQAKKEGRNRCVRG